MIFLFLLWFISQLCGWEKLINKLTSIMSDNVKGMLFTAGAVVVGVLVASMIQTRLLDKMGGDASDDASDMG